MTTKVSKEQPKGKQKSQRLKIKKETLKDLQASGEKLKGGGTMETRRATCSCGGAC